MNHTTPHLSRSHLVEGKVDFSEWVAVGDERLQFQLSFLVEVKVTRDVSRWIRLAPFDAGEHLAKMQGQGMNGNILIVLRHTDQNRPALSSRQGIGSLYEFDHSSVFYCHIHAFSANNPSHFRRKVYLSGIDAVSR